MNATLPDLVVAAFLAFCRVGGCFLVMPGLSSVRVPMQVRLFVAVAATFALLVHMWDTLLPLVGRRPDALAVLVASETIIGVLIGLLARIYVLAFQFIGTAIATLIGYGTPSGVSIEESEAQAALTSILTFSALLMLFVLDFHHEIIKAITTSYRVLPPDSLFAPRPALVDLTDTLAESFFMMLQLGSPFVAYALLVNIAIGFINKLTPQIPVYFISLPFVIAGGLLLLYFAVPTLLSLFGNGILAVTIAR